MPKFTSVELRTERAKLMTENRELLDSVDGESLSADQQTEFDERADKIDSLEGEVERHEKAEGYSVDQNLASVRDSQAEAVAEVEEREVSDEFDTDEYRAAFREYMENPTEAFAAREKLKVGANENGGYTVAQDWNRQLVQSLQQFGVMRSVATVITTADAGQFHVPTEATTGEATQKAEAEAYAESEPTFGTVALDSFKLTELIKVTDEMLNDSIFDIPAYVQARAGKNIALAENKKLVIGSGSGEANGVTKAIPSGQRNTAESATAVKIDELISLVYKIVPGYLANAKFVAHNETIAALRQKKDKNEQYLWSPSVQAGQPDTFLGYPVLPDPHMPTMATGNVSVVFGDFSGYWIRDVQTTVVKFLDQTYAAEGIVAFRVSRRSDGDLVDTASLVALKQA